MRIEWIREDPHVGVVHGLDAWPFDLATVKSDAELNLWRASLAAPSFELGWYSSLSGALAAVERAAEKLAVAGDAFQQYDEFGSVAIARRVQTVVTTTAGPAPVFGDADSNDRSSP